MTRSNSSAAVSALIVAGGLVLAGCASTQVTRQPVVTGQLPRPATVWVYDFAATAADLPADSALVGEISADPAPQAAGDLATGRRLGAQVATDLVAEIRDMGIPAAHAGAGTTPRVNDIVIRGCLISFEEGDATKRVVVGFGRGASELRAAVEGLQVTPEGLRRLGSGTADAGGSKTPGATLGVVGLAATHNPAGLIVSTGMKVYGEKSGNSKVEGRARQTAREIAGVLKERFKQQGWID